jgi:hypothetical protein
MCMNCGCGKPHEAHGKSGNILAEDLQRASDANGQSLRESAQHILETVERLEASPRGDGAPAERSLAEPAGSQGTATGGRGTPASES